MAKPKISVATKNRKIAMEYRKRILKSLDSIEKLAPGSTKNLVAEAMQTENAGTLFRMHQTLREALAEANDNDVDVSFTMTMPDGKIRKFRNLEELDDYAKAFKDRSHQ